MSTRIDTPHTVPARTRDDRRARSAMTVETAAAGIIVRTPYVEGEHVLMTRATNAYADVIARRVDPSARISHRFQDSRNTWRGIVHVYRIDQA